MRILSGHWKLSEIREVSVIFHGLSRKGRMGGGGGGSLNLEILRGGEAQAVLEIQVERGVKKPCLPLVGCGFFLE